MKWFKTQACKSHAFCWKCRTSESFRESIVARGLVDLRDFDCPQGITEETAQAAVDGRVTAIMRPPKDCGPCRPVPIVGG